MQQRDDEEEPQARTSGGRLSVWGCHQEMIKCVLVGLPKELKKNKAPHIDKESSRLSVLILFVQIFSGPDGTDKLVLSTIFRQECQTEPPSSCYSAKQ
jgi:hypothetical protein